MGIMLGIAISHGRAHEGGQEDLDQIRIDRIQKSHRSMEYPWTHGEIKTYKKIGNSYLVNYQDGSTWEYKVTETGGSYKMIQE